MLAKVDAANQLTHNDKVNALVHNGLFQRGGIRQLGPDLGRAVVGVQSHAGTQAQQALLRALVAGQALPLGAADGPQQDAVGVLALFQFRSGQRVAEFINGLAAHVGAGIRKRMAVLFCNFIQHAHRLGHDLRAGTVTVDQSNVFLHSSLSPSRCYCRGGTCPALSLPITEHFP